MLESEQNIFIIATAVIFFAVCVFFILRKRKNSNQIADKNEVAEIETPTNSEINDYTIVEVQPNMSELTKWTTLIKNSAKQIYNAKNFHAEANALWKIADESERPLLVLVMGEFSTGKSTFINTLLGEDILTTDNLQATAVITLLTFGTEKTAKIHYLDGTTENYELSKLQDITAEGDETKKALREKIEYVELTYPNELLKKITVVDTPGKNGTEESHNQSTENFKNRADMVIWMFNAMKMGKRSELAEIEALGKRLKPLVIINKIDDLEEVGETAEEKIPILRKKLGDNVGDILGISAKKANEALKNGDKNLLAESRWEEFNEYMQNQIAIKSETLKIKAIHDKLADFLALLENSVTNKKHYLQEREKYFTNSDESKKNLVDSINNIFSGVDFCKERISLIDNMKPTVKKISDFQSYSNMDNIPDDVTQTMFNLMDMELQVIFALDNLKDFLAQLNGGTKFISDIEIYIDQAEREKMYSEEWDAHLYKIADMSNDLDGQRKHIRNLTEDYMHSGFGGGEPIFDFSGRRARLNETKSEYNQSIERFNKERRAYFNKGFTMVGQWYKLDKEVRKLYERIIKFLTDESEKYSNELENLKNNFKIEQAKYNQNLKSLYYLQKIMTSLRQILNRNLQPLDLNQLKVISSLVVQNEDIPTPVTTKKEIAAESNDTNSNRGITIFLLCVFCISVAGIWYLFFQSPSHSEISPKSTPRVTELDKKSDSVNQTEEKPKFVTPTPYKPSGKIENPKPKENQNKNKKPTLDYYEKNARSELSIGGVCIDDNFDRVREILGSNYSITGNNQYNPKAKVYQFNDIEMIIKNNKVVYMKTLTSRLKTKRGIHAGSTRQQVLNAYGNKPSSFTKDGILYHEYWINSPDGNRCLLRFAMRNDVVEYVGARIFVN